MPQYYDSLHQQMFQNMPQQPYQSMLHVYQNMPQAYPSMPLQFSQFTPQQLLSQQNYEPQMISGIKFDTDRCMCSCDRCSQEPEPCCAIACLSCPPAFAPQTTLEHNSLVLVPYPYPLLVSNLHENVTTSTTTTTTTIKTTTTTKASKNKSIVASSTEEDKITRSHRNLKQILPVAKRRTRPAWVPKYGIVPIPDDMAVKLMSQLRELRAYQRKL